eukprot:7183775-Alexandrium_andersonii.AAC.1
MTANSQAIGRRPVLPLTPNCYDFADFLVRYPFGGGGKRAPIMPRRSGPSLVGLGWKPVG